MEDKYNHLNVAEYSTHLAKSLCDGYFAEKQKISGSQLISFSPIRQINLFVIRELLVQWNREMATLRSPYFDYDNEEVKTALVQFMNVLSRKILMERGSFEPLLSKAIYDTFMVVLDPVSVLHEKFLSLEEEPTHAALQDSLKYIDLDKSLFRGFIESMADSRLQQEYVLDRFRQYVAEHSEQRTSLDALLALFQPLKPVSRQDICGKSPVLSVEDTPVTTPPPPAPPTPEPARKPVPPEIRIEQVSKPAAVTTRVAAPLGPAAPLRAPERAVNLPRQTSDGNLNEKYKVEKPSRAESYAKASTSSLVESHTNKPIQSLRESISINQRYGFINELFSGDNMDYHATIKALDGFGEADAAKHYLLQDVSRRYDWSKKEEHVNKLIRLIERKFA